MQWNAPSQKFLRGNHRQGLLTIGLRLFREGFGNGQFLHGGVTIVEIAPIGADDFQCLRNLFTQLRQRLSPIYLIYGQRFGSLQVLLSNDFAHVI